MLSFVGFSKYMNSTLAALAEGTVRFGFTFSVDASC